MAGPYFVRSGAAGAGTGADWTNAFTTLALCIAGGLVAGDTIWVADDHAESTAAAVTLTFPGTVASPNFIYCVDHTKASPGTGDLLTTGTVATTGASTLTIQGSFYCYGLTFTAGNGANTANLVFANTNCFQSYSACQLNQGTSVANSTIIGTSGAVAARVTLDNTTMKFANASSVLSPRGCELIWRNTASAITGTAPSPFISASQVNVWMMTCEGVDLSAIGSGKTLVGAGNQASKAFFKECAFGASVTVAAAPTGPSGPETFVINSDSGATNYRSEKYAYTGTETTETTIVRSGGASDGTTSQSRKIVTTANSKWVLPFNCLPIPVWIDSTGSKTITVHAVSGAAGGLNNDDIWITAEYLGSALTPLGSFATSTKANNLATGSAYSASGATWAGSPSGTPFSMAVTLTTAQKGLVYVYVRVAKASATVYVDPKVVVT